MARDLELPAPSLENGGSRSTRKRESGRAKLRYDKDLSGFVEDRKGRGFPRLFLYNRGVLTMRQRAKGNVFLPLRNKG